MAAAVPLDDDEKEEDLVSSALAALDDLGVRTPADVAAHDPRALLVAVRAKGGAAGLTLADVVAWKRRAVLAVAAEPWLAGVVTDTA